MNSYNDNYNSVNNLIAYSDYGERSHSIFIVKENNLNEDNEMKINLNYCFIIKIIKNNSIIFYLLNGIRI